MLHKSRIWYLAIYNGKTVTVQEGLVTESDFSNFYIEEYPTADNTSRFTSLDGLFKYGYYDIVDSRINARPSKQTNKQYG